ncbi:MAG: hypothetical protein JWP27_627 [Flaviaesturariibacter sp.]|nr:hypothetical protein [Flaviaesturariibacter sp.]
MKTHIMLSREPAGDASEAKKQFAMYIDDTAYHRVVMLTHVSTFLNPRGVRLAECEPGIRIKSDL